MRAALLGLAVLAAHAASLLAAFQFDDYNVIVQNPSVQSLAALAEELPRGLRPVLKASYAFSWTTGGGEPFAFHAFNVLAHALNAILLYLIGLQLAARWKPGLENAVLCAALLFALHPVQTEAITYASGRSVSLAASFYLGALLVYLRHGPAWASLGLFALACGTRETALTLPAALLLCELATPLRAPWREIARRQGAYWVVAAVLAATALWHDRYAHFVNVAFNERSIADNLLSQVQGLGYLVSRLFLLHRMNIDPALPALSDWDAALAFQGVALFALLALGVASLKRRPWIGFGLCWFFVHLAPTSSVVPRLDVANERHLYLALWGLALAVSVQLASLGWPKRAVQSVAATVLAGLAVFSISRQLDYRSEIALWEAAVREAPWNARAYNNLGYARALAGDQAGAIREYRQALAFDPADVRARHNLEVALSGLRPR
jgi:tetratricopeptide (TPR) repeat protein